MVKVVLALFQTEVTLTVPFYWCPVPVCLVDGRRVATAVTSSS